MTHLPPDHPLARVLLSHLGTDPGQCVNVERLRASRPVFRFFLPGDGLGLVGKFFVDQVPASAQDRSLAREYDNYLGNSAQELAAAGLIPRLVGRAPGVRLGLLLEGLPGPDLDYYLAEAAQGRGLERCLRRLARLAELLAFFHTRPLPRQTVSPEPVLAYFRKLRNQLQVMGLLSSEEVEVLAAESRAWEGRVVAVDLERLRPGDRLFDVSWVAGELRHAWGWRGREFCNSEAAIQTFLRAYLQALPAGDELTQRIFALNPLYMALAELRIARNSYLSWEYRRALVAEARRCLSFGRRLT